MGIQRVRTAVKDAVESAGLIAGGKQITCLDFTPDSIEPPTFYTGEIENLQPNVDYGGRTDQYVLVCRVLASSNDDAAGQQALDAMIERTGPGSVRAAIMTAAGEPGEYALSGACDAINIVSIQGYRSYLVGEKRYFGAEIRVFIIGAGDGE